MTAPVEQEVGLGDPPRSWRAAALVPTLISVAALVAIMNSLGAPLIPTIASHDHVSLSTGQWLLTAALLTGALATPVMGRLADGPKQRQVIFVALSVVLVGCVVAAVSDRFIVVVAGRALQGVGLGLLPVTMAMARSHLPMAKAGRAIATLSITTAVGAGLGYPLTGIVAEAFGVHAAFWFAGLLVAGALAIAIVVLPPSPPVAARRFDLIGAGALSLVVIGISVALSEGGEWGWTSTRTLVIVVVSLIILAGWIPHELRHHDPLIDLRQVRHRSVLTADVSGFLICVAIYLFTPIVVEFVQIPVDHGFGFGASVVVSGLVFLPLSVGTVVASRCLPFYERRFGTRSMIPLGSVIFAISTLFFALEHRALWEAFVSVRLRRLRGGLHLRGHARVHRPGRPPGETGSATGFYQVLRSIGLSLGSALAAAVLTAYTLQGHTFPTEEGFRVALLVASGLCLTTAVISYLLPGRADAPPTARTEQERRAADLIMEEEAELAGSRDDVGRGVSDRGTAGRGASDSGTGAPIDMTVSDTGRRTSPPPRPGRPRDAAASRLALLDAAQELFGKKGFERTTIREIGDAAGVDAALIARYFGSKADLYIAAVVAESRDDQRPREYERVEQMAEAAGDPHRRAGAGADRPGADPIGHLRGDPGGGPGPPGPPAHRAAGGRHGRRRDRPSPLAGRDHRLRAHRGEPRPLTGLVRGAAHRAHQRAGRPHHPGARRSGRPGGG